MCNHPLTRYYFVLRYLSCSDLNSIVKLLVEEPESIQANAKRPRAGTLDGKMVLFA